MAEKRYFATRDCVFNRQHFAKYTFWSESDLVRGLGPRDKPQQYIVKGKDNTPVLDKEGKPVMRPGNKYMVELSEPKGKRPADVQELIDDAINSLEGDLELLRSQGSRPSRGITNMIKKTETILTELRSA